MNEVSKRSCVDDAMDALKEYIKNGTKPIVPENSSQNDFAVWQATFENEQEIYDDLILQENKSNATWHANNYMSENLTEDQRCPIMKLIGVSAHWETRTIKDKNLKQKIQKIWEDAFDKINKKDKFIESLKAAQERF
ncbi:MAG: hypothetical protein EKK64_06630 [Neisseriaceae bacterium]|nr:MAG: hypothetical protein EKK64_06630 [Neisseriaceae bacterium]